MRELTLYENSEQMWFAWQAIWNIIWVEFELDKILDSMVRFINEHFNGKH